MALIDLQTDLKSLKYGKDRIGGGSSNQPFVQKPIPDSFSAVGNTGGLDVLTRGGSLVFERTADDVSRLTKLLLTGNTFQGPFFTIKQNVLSRQGVQTQASPKGYNEDQYLPTNTLAQVAVSATGLHFNKQGLRPIPGTPGSLVTYSDIIDDSFLNPGIKSINNNRLIKYTDNFVNSVSGNTLYSYLGGPGSILGLGKTTIQTPVDQRTGINRDNTTSGTITAGVTLGLTDGLYKINGLKNPNDLLGASVSASLFANSPGALLTTIGASVSASLLPGALPTTNNLTTLDSLKLTPFLGTRANILTNTNSKYTTVSGLTTPGDFELFTPRISPEGLYQGNTPSARERAIGTTPFTGDSSFTKPTEKARTQEQVLDNLQAFTYTQEQLETAPSYRTSLQIQDFRQQLRNQGADAKAVGADILAPSYTEENIENRVHLGNPGTKGDVSDYTKGKKSLVTGLNLGAVDTLNAITLYQSDNVRQDDASDVNDLVKFRIAVMDPNGGDKKTYIHFRAFLDAITDNYSTDWSSHRYVGRGENFWTYQGFDRTISLGWTVYAQSREELIPMYKRLNYLASSLAPDYNNGFMRGLLCQLTIGGYVYEQPGFIRSLTYELSDQSTWEIGINDKGFTEPENRGDALVKELPHMIKVTGFNFTPIHTFIPEVQKNTYGANGDVASFGRQRYIALNNGYNNNYDNQ